MIDYCCSYISMSLDYAFIFFDSGSLVRFPIPINLFNIIVLRLVLVERIVVLRYVC